jgi:hypothetical protein
MLDLRKHKRHLSYRTGAAGCAVASDLLSAVLLVGLAERHFHPADQA